jgi:hypothetical protein
MIDPHLAKLRRVKSLRLGGMSYTKIGDRMGYTGPTIKKMIAQANDLRTQGRLYADMNARDDIHELYTENSISRRKHRLALNGVSVD